MQDADSNPFRQENRNKAHFSHIPGEVLSLMTSFNAENSSQEIILLSLQTTIKFLQSPTGIPTMLITRSTARGKKKKNVRMAKLTDNSALLPYISLMGPMDATAIIHQHSFPLGPEFYTLHLTLRSWCKYACMNNRRDLLCSDSKGINNLVWESARTLLCRNRRMFYTRIKKTLSYNKSNRIDLACHTTQ